MGSNNDRNKRFVMNIGIKLSANILYKTRDEARTQIKGQTSKQFSEYTINKIGYYLTWLGISIYWEIKEEL